MLLSMTGYGKASCEYSNKKITVEVKSLNSKQIDISMRIANVYREKDINCETLLRKNWNVEKLIFRFISKMQVDKRQQPSIERW